MLLLVAQGVFQNAVHAAQTLHFVGHQIYIQTAGFAHQASVMVKTSLPW